MLDRRLPFLDFKLLVLDFLFYFLGIESFDLEIDANVGKQRHVLVRDPDEGEPGDNVSAPVEKEEFVAGEDEEEQRYIMTEAVFAGEQVEELAFPERRAFTAATDAVLAGLAEDLFVRDGPRNTGDGDGEHEQPNDLDGQRHGGWMRIESLRVVS